MKLNFLKPILAGALTFGLMTFAADQSKAAVVIGGQLYSPLNLKLVINYYNATGSSFQKMSASSKDILSQLGWPTSDQLALGPLGDVYVIDKSTVVADLTATGYFSVQFNQLLYTATSHNLNGAYSFKEMGVLAVNYYSDGGLDDTSGHSSSYWFELSGNYSNSGQVSATVGNQQTIKASFKASTLGGQGFDLGANNVNSFNTLVPVSGGISGSGSGKNVQAPPQ